MTGAPTPEEMQAGFHSAAKAIEAERKGDVPSDAPVKPSLETPDEKRRLRSIVDRIVRLEEEKKGLSADIKEILEEAKSAGYSKKSIRIVVRHEMEDAEQRAAREATEEEAESIKIALGDFASSPLGEAATRKRH